MEQNGQEIEIHGDHACNTIKAAVLDPSQSRFLLGYGVSQEVIDQSWDAVLQEGVDEFRGDLVEDTCGEVVVAKELLVAFDGPRGDLDSGLEIQGILDVGSKDIGFDGLLSVPTEEVGEEDEAGHGIEFFGRRAEGFAEVFSEVADGHDFEEDVSKESLPAVGDDPSSDGRDDALEGVEEAVLSGIDGVDHGRTQLLVRRQVKYRVASKRVKRKLAVRSGIPRSCVDI